MMTERHTDLPTDLLDRYLRGEASPEDERTLAQQALHDQELFDLLTTIGLTKAALRTDGARGRLPVASGTKVMRPARGWRRPTMLVWAGVAAAAVLLLAVLTRSAIPRHAAAPVATSTDRTPAADAPTVPRAGVEVRRPAFLAARLELPAGTERGPVFRGGGSASARRLARVTGTVVSAESGIARVDVGAIDGLVTGSILIVEPDPAANLPESRATVTAVFRDEARVDVAGDVRTGRQVRVDTTVHLAALSALIADALAAGDTALVRAGAGRASIVARDRAAQADVRRLALLQLAALSRARSDGAAAEQYVREAMQLADTAPPATAVERAEMLNALGTIVAADGKLKDAEDVLRQARAVAPPGSAVAAQVLNNLGAITALRGDLTGARTWYRSALALLSGPHDQARRATVERNLSLVETSQ